MRIPGRTITVVFLSATVLSQSSFCGHCTHGAQLVVPAAEIRTTASKIESADAVGFTDEVDLLPLRDAILLSATSMPQKSPVNDDRGVELPLLPGQTDWSAFAAGDLILRVRDHEGLPAKLRVELHASGTSPPVVSGVDLTSLEFRGRPGRRFADIALPLGQSSSPGNLAALSKLRIRPTDVSGKHAAQANGSILSALHSIRITAGTASAETQSVTAESLAVAAFEWFETYREAETGLVPDRAPNQTFIGPPPSRQLFCSIASVGYYLSLLPNAVSRGRLSEQDAESRAEQVLTFLEQNAEHRSGLFYHFIDMKSGKRFFDCEYSALDTAILLNGCMVVSVRFGGDVADIADRLTDRVDWNAYRLPENDQRSESLSMGWKPGVGLLGAMDVRSSEFAMPYLLAVGAKVHAIPPSLWTETERVEGRVAGISLLNPTHGLFTSYYGLSWHSEKFCRAIHAYDLWQNAKSSARANRVFSHLERNPTYSTANGGWWGISAGDSPDGYFAPGLIAGSGRGTVWPTAAVAAWPWAAEQLQKDLIDWQASPVWDHVCGPYGLAPFNIERNWVGEDLIGIDIGSLAVNVVNHQTGEIWNLWTQHPGARRAIERLCAGEN